MLRYVVLVIFFVIFSTCSARRFNHIQLPPGAVGPETLAFDCQGQGPYVGVSDGRILKYNGLGLGWSEYAQCQLGLGVVSGSTLHHPNVHVEDLSVLSFTSKHVCYMLRMLIMGYAYHGLVEVGPGGGQGFTVAQAAGGVPFKFTNSLDINTESGMVYFTDSSTRFERWEFQRIFDTGDHTGRVIAFNPLDRSVRVLLKDLPFPNGVALGINNEFLLISETTMGRIYKLWLKGPRVHQSDLLLTLQGRPDNINRDSTGNFWIAQVPGLLSRPGSGDGGFCTKINSVGNILERLDGTNGGHIVTRASDVKEVAGKVLLGNVVHPYISASY